MTEPGIKLTTYFEERDRIETGFLADALFDVYERHRMRTSVMLRGISGFGQRHDVHTERLLTLSEDLPAVSIAVDTVDRVERMLPDVLAIAKHGLVSLERAQLAGDGIDGIALPRETGAAVKLTVYLTDMGSFASVNEVYESFFESDPPARVAIAVAGLPRGALVEIDAIVALP